jgi:hypothetical protein
MKKTNEVRNGIPEHTIAFFLSANFWHVERIKMNFRIQGYLQKNPAYRSRSIVRREVARKRARSLIVISGSRLFD